ncbi:MAG: hypothetical protein DRP08_05760 [Candidatus Aenigmatarchaeota archaeon]|nr:MAG: hypothetical protein DRP08_05760 [Candidatus Aenigmarchaeota archaeon]
MPRREVILPPELDELVSEYEARLRGTRMSQLYRDYAVRMVRKYLAFCVENGLDPRKAQSIMEYQNDMEGVWAATSARTFAYVLSGFFKKVGWPWPLERKEIPRGRPHRRPFYTEEEMELLLETAKRMGPKEYAIVRLARLLGLRRIEIRMLNVEDYQPPHLYIRAAKHGVSRWRRLDEETCRAIEEYLKWRGKRKERALFLSGRRGGRITLRSLTRLLNRVRKEAGLYEKKPWAGFHAFRRGLVTELHKLGVSEKELQEWMGWQTPFMPHEYIRLVPTEVEEKITKVHPIYRRGG